MVSRQWRERQIGKRVRINPHHLIDLTGRLDRAFDIHDIERRVQLKSRLVCRRAIEYAQYLHAGVLDPATQFLGDFTRQRGDVAFANAAFAAGLHERHGPALADHQNAAVLVANKRGHHRDDPFAHSSSPENNPNCAGSRAGSDKPRCRKATEVRRRPRGVRCRKPFWIRNGSMMSSMASRGSDSAAASVSTPTGPPP